MFFSFWWTGQGLNAGYCCFQKETCEAAKTSVWKANPVLIQKGALQMWPQALESRAECFSLTSFLGAWKETSPNSKELNAKSGEENCGGLGQEEKLKCESGNMRKLDIKEEQDLDDQKEMNQNHVSKKSYNRNSDVSEIQCHKHHK